MMNLSIQGLSYYIPKGRLTNQEVIDRYIDDIGRNLNGEELDLLKYSSLRKLEFLEIENRSCCGESAYENSIEMAVRVAEMAVRNAGMSVLDIDLILFTGVCNPFREPSYAMIIANEIGAFGTDFYDIGDACNGFLKALELSSLYINSGKAKTILVVTCESPLELLEQTKDTLAVNSLEEADYKMNLLFAGTGAAAFVLTGDNGRKSLLSYGEQRNCRDWDLSLYLSPKIHLPVHRLNEINFTTWGDGRKIAAGIIKEMPDFVLTYLEKNQVEASGIKYIFTHQLGRNITYSIINKINAKPERVFPINTFKEYGNMGSANIPVGLALAEEKKLLTEGDILLLLGSSVGLTYSAVTIRW